ncbi:Villin/Gelsolin [Cynara cardunculus var. scolymus]|uniref:Villin/Gelsolin n=1 Tax=Cynara cardunculus var. scolymus TaxID=59895 RepID=A0A118K789_CYNCS|nr:Villin/Gelsolin [Cynara cardunculus var. scolymus]
MNALALLGTPYQFQAVALESHVLKGIEVWRIENFKPVVVPQSSYGKFFTGDSYVILKGTRGIRGKKEKRRWSRGEKEHDGHGAGDWLDRKCDDLHQPNRAMARI